MSYDTLLSQFSLLGRIWSWSFLLRNRLIFGLHHTPHRLFFLLVKMASLALSLCNTLVLHVQSGSWGTALWNWILHRATGKGRKISEWDMSVAKYRVLNLELWCSWFGKCSCMWFWCACLSFWSPTVVSSDIHGYWERAPSEGNDELKISVSGDLVWVECFGHKQHWCPFRKSMF